MPVKVFPFNTKYKVCAWINADGQCEFEGFIADLRKRSQVDCKKVVSLITKAAKYGLSDDEELCRLVAGVQNEDLREFVTPGGIRVFWFYQQQSIVICSCAYLKTKQEIAHNLAIEIKKALSIKRQILEEEQ